jgi:hypothetical protein
LTYPAQDLVNRRNDSGFFGDIGGLFIVFAHLAAQKNPFFIFPAKPFMGLLLDDLLYARPDGEACLIPAVFVFPPDAFKLGLWNSVNFVYHAHIPFRWCEQCKACPRGTYLRRAANELNRPISRSLSWSGIRTSCRAMICFVKQQRRLGFEIFSFDGGASSPARARPLPEQHFKKVDIFVPGKHRLEFFTAHPVSAVACACILRPIKRTRKERDKRPLPVIFVWVVRRRQGRR